MSAPKNAGRYFLTISSSVGAGSPAHGYRLSVGALPLLKVGGKMLAMKGPKLAEELPAAEHVIRLMGGGRPDIHPAELPGAHQHVIVEISKDRKTPARFPRPATQTKGKPLR